MAESPADTPLEWEAAPRQSFTVDLVPGRESGVSAVTPRQAAIRKTFDGVAQDLATSGQATATLPDVGLVRIRYIDPAQKDMSWTQRLREGYWANKQQHGRPVYDKMYEHPAVQAPFNMRMSVIRSVQGSFVPATDAPTERQKEMVAFCNDQVDRLSIGGKWSAGWHKLCDGFFGSGLKYGFSVAEPDWRLGQWSYLGGRPKTMKQIDRVFVLPQASLDTHGRVDDRMGELFNSSMGDYECFKLDASGREIEAVVQFSKGASLTENQVVWQGSELANLFIFKRKGGDGNPFGESILFGAFMPWSDLYVRERDEQVFLDVNSRPKLTVSYDSDVPNVALHDEIKNILQEQDYFSVLIARRATFGNVTAISEAYTKHLGQNKKELRQYIAQSLLVPSVTYEVSEANEQNARDMIQMFLKYTLPADLGEIEEFMTGQFGKRLVDANWSNVLPQDYPKWKFRVVFQEDLKAAMPLLQQGVRWMDASRVGELLELFISGFRREWIPASHEQSVDVMRPLRDANDEPNGPGGAEGGEGQGGQPPSRKGERGVAG